MTDTPTRYIVSDGKLTLQLEYDSEFKGYAVTSPFNSELITQAHSLEEAFEMAYDALDALAQAAVIPRKRTGRVESVGSRKTGQKKSRTSQTT